MSSPTPRSQDDLNSRGTPVDFKVRSSRPILLCAGIPSAIDEGVIDFCDVRRRAGFNVRSDAAKKVSAGGSDGRGVDR